MASDTGSRFDASLGCLFEAEAEELATRLSHVPALSPRARDIVVDATRAALIDTLNLKLARLLVLELNAARVEERLKGSTPQERWDEFVALSSTREFWNSLSQHYPTLRARVERICGNICGAAFAFALRWAADRPKLGALCGGEPGDMKGLTFGAGDTHRGGSTVAIVACDNASVVYKPRSVAPEAGLARFIAAIERDLDCKLSVRVPKVLDCGDHGWAEFIAHRHAADAEELGLFYRGIGQWLAIMRLLGGNDFHSENLIAHGRYPVIVDAETLFAPNIAPLAQGLGDATDKAVRLVSGTVLATGLLPQRGASLGWRGVDMSGVGGVEGQQPTLMLPGIIGHGSDTARIGLAPMELLPQKNHPTAQPSLIERWPDVLKGFEDLSHALSALDADGRLAARMAHFKDCRIRVIVRPTAVYAEIGRMLWHPVSLHNEAKARAQAHDLLMKMAGNVAAAPGDPKVVAAEIADLLIGDIPYFATVAGHGVLDGPGGASWLRECDLVEDALRNWRGADLALESNYVRTALVSAYSNDDGLNLGNAMNVITTRTRDLDTRRRRQAAVAMRKLIDTAIRGEDGTVTWIAPSLSTDGMAVRVLGNDAYGGLSGITIATAAYLKETRAGRADAVEGTQELLDGMRKTLRAGEDKRERLLREGSKSWPPAIGAYLGLGSQIWRHLALTGWGFEDADDIAHAVGHAREIPSAAAYDDLLDMLTGRAGAIPPLLALARRTGDAQVLDIARGLGDELCARARRDGDRAWWVHERWPEGLGGFAHGSTGMGWALFKLADATGDARYRETAQAAFAFEDSLFDEDQQNWRDLRNLGGPDTGCAWCHGAVGIGLARLDLDPRLEKETTRSSLRTAAATAWQFGLGSSHCACHGSIGTWEILDRASALGEGPKGVTREEILSSVVSALEDSGPSYGMLKDAFVPGLLLGMSGVVYQLLRADPASALPSFLVLEGLDTRAAPQP